MTKRREPYDGGYALYLRSPYRIDRSDYPKVRKERSHDH